MAMRRSNLPVWALLMLLAALPLGCVAPRFGDMERFEFTRPQMGVPFRIVLFARDSAHAESAAKAAFSRVSQLNQIMSDYETDSELTLLSQTAGKGVSVPVSFELWRVLERSQQLAERTDGAFDVTVGPCVTLWRKARRDKQFPDAARLEQARAATGYRNLRLNKKDRSALLRVPGMRLDLGGIAKGYAVDEALKTLKQHGIRSALVSGGGDFAASSPPPGRDGWQIELSSLDSAAPRRFIWLKDAALTTSGDTFQFVEMEGRRYSHIVDPRTGIGLTDHSLVMVIAKDCMTSDSLATAISVLGPEDGLQLLRKYTGAAARVERQPTDVVEVHESPGFRHFYAPVR